MKCSTLIVTTLMLSASLLMGSPGRSQSIKEKLITLEVHNSPLRTALNKVEKLSGFRMAYAVEQVTRYTHISLVKATRSVDLTLQLLLANTSLDYRQDGNTIIIFPKAATTQRTIPVTVYSAADSSIRGKVTNNNGEPLQGVNVTVKGTTNGTSTNAAGEFELHEVPANATLILSYIGYAINEVKLNGRTWLPWQLTRLVNELDSVVIVSNGYQDIPADRAPGSFVQINRELFNRRVSPDVLSRLDGIASGVIFNTNRVKLSNENAYGEVTIRGVAGILSDVKPLIVIDNYPYEGDINNINPNDVQSVSILKDAAAASIWGARAGNGVIVITTKKGKYNEKLNISVNANTSIGAKPDLYYNQGFLNSSDFIDIETLLFNANYYSSEINSANKIPLSPVVEILLKKKNGVISDAEATNSINALRQIDYRNDLSNYFYRHSVQHQVAVNLEGGSSNFNYFFSAGFDRSLPSEVGNESKRLTLTTQNAYRPFKNFELSLGIQYANSDIQRNNIGVADMRPYSTKQLYPYADLVDDDGNALAIVRDYRNNYLDTLSNPNLLNWRYKPYEEMSKVRNETGREDIRLNLGARYSIAAGLSLDVKYQFQKENSLNNIIYSEESYFARNLINRYTSVTNNVVTRPIPPGGILDKNYTTVKSWLARPQLNYSTSFGINHDLTAIAGAEVREVIVDGTGNRFYGYNDEFSSIATVNYTTQYPLYYNTGLTAQVPFNDRVSGSTDRYVSYYFNGAYTYAKKITLSASARKDGSNLFGVNINQKAVPLWSTGISYKLSEEKFYTLHWLPYLNLRLTYGYNGNIYKSVTAFTTASISGINSYAGLPYASIISPANPELRWEKISNLNIAVDFASFNKRISGSIEFYQKKARDLFGVSNFVPSSGWGSAQIVSNSGQMKSHGVDLTLNARIIDRRFSWQLSLLYNYISDKVTEYGREYEAIYYTDYDGTRYPMEGKPVYGIYSYKWAGLDAATGEPLGILNGQPSKDYLALNSIPASELQYHGRATPAQFGSLLNSFSYKGVSLSVNVIYKLGYFFRRTSSINPVNNSWVAHADYTKRWQKPGDELITDIPSFIYPFNNSRASFYNRSAALIEKGDHIRLQDISVSYQVPVKNMRLLPFSSLHVYAYINNLGILWKANNKGLDPDAGFIPPARSYSLGIRANF